MQYDPEIGVNLRNSGEYTVYAKAIDVVGNESAPVEYHVYVDVHAPTGNAAYTLDIVGTDNVDESINDDQFSSFEQNALDGDSYNNDAALYQDQEDALDGIGYDDYDDYNDNLTTEEMDNQIINQ